ncbi:Xylose isomerase-like TIM barrel [Serratia marcescens]|nr:Xylose isomerase-like TIM barrel [Serratia marcescens]
MKLSFCTDSLGHLPFEPMLDRLLELGVRGVEMTTGGWSPAPHLDTEELLANPAKRRQLQQALASRGMEIAALNVSGNPLDPGELGQRHLRQTDNTLELAGLLGVKKIVMMSGLPPASPHDTVPNWITYTVSWPPTVKNCLDYQWNEVAGRRWSPEPKRAASSALRWKTSAPCWCGTRKRCSGCAKPLARWWA